MLRWEQQALPLPPPACRAGALLNELCSLGKLVLVTTSIRQHPRPPRPTSAELVVDCLVIIRNPANPGRMILRGLGIRIPGNWIVLGTVKLV